MQEHNCCHSYREDETKFLKQVIKSEEYLDNNILCRAVIVHNSIHINFIY